MKEIKKAQAIRDLIGFVRAIEQVIDGAVVGADLTDSEVRGLLVDMLDDEVSELREKWEGKAYAGTTSGGQ